VIVLDAISALLKAASGVTDIVGQRIYPSYAPIGVANPYITFEVVDDEPSDTKAGASRLDSYLVQVSCYHKQAKIATNIASQVRGALDRFTGITALNVIDRIKFERVDGVYWEEEQELYRCDMEFMVRCRVDFGSASANWEVPYIVNVDGVEQATGNLNVLEDQTININL